MPVCDETEEGTGEGGGDLSDPEPSLRKFHQGCGSIPSHGRLSEGATPTRHRPAPRTDACSLQMGTARGSREVPP